MQHIHFLLKFGTQGFLDSPITNTTLFLQNSKWRIKMADKIFENQPNTIKSGIFRVADYEYEVTFAKFKMVDSRWRTKFLKVNQIRSNRYTGVFGVADYEYEVTFAKFKMVDPRWRTKFLKSTKYDQIWDF